MCKLNLVIDPKQVLPWNNKYFSGAQNILLSIFGLESAACKTGDTYTVVTKTDRFNRPWGDFTFPSPPMSPPFGPQHKKPSCYLMFHENQLAGRISACKWNVLFPWNLQDLKDISPLLANMTWGLPALTFDKKGHLQLPAACQHQTVTFQTTVNFTDL